MGKIHQIEGTLFKIKRFSIHDGPGIRTSLFLKGCPLNCVWCHNPEGINPDISIWHDRKLCIGCGRCENVCPTNALQYTGYKITVAESIREIEKDLAYYQTSGGGVTLTGGEPLYQPDFLIEILKACKEKNIHTAVETCLYCEKEIVKSVLPFVDMFIVDLKIFEPCQHTIFTGKSNENIKENFRYIAVSEKNVLVRIPLIHNITDTNENKEAIIDFVSEVNEKIQIEFINFNPLTENKYTQLGLPFPLKKM